MVSFPPCKINLGLNIIRKRPDGYHDIETCFYPVPYCDVLEIIPAATTEFSSSGKIIPGESNDNLCLKAYQLLGKEFSLPHVKIHLHKLIPTGAGLGGGSSDAAHTIRLLAEKFSLALSLEQQAARAAILGSDCSFFIYDSPMTASGRGEILKPSSISLKGKFLLLLNPGIHLSTAEAYAGVTPAEPALSIEHILTLPIQKWQTLLVNDFEKSVFARFPLISNLKQELYAHGALYAAMSGSGSTVFGIFDHEVDVRQSSLHPYVIWKGLLS
jgi:4-diphosphocytidyl-2-C-methyl-D-erythritol kinase